MTMPSCDVITRDRRHDVELVGGPRLRAAKPRPRTCCCPPWFLSTSPQSAAADSAALYEYTYAQRTLGATETADKRLRPSPRCIVRDRASLPPLLPPPPPPRDRHSSCTDPPSPDTWTRLGSVDHHEVFIERCPHSVGHCPSSTARHLVVPATTTVGDVGPPGSTVHYHTRSQLMTMDVEQSVPPTSSSTSAELQLCRPIDSQQSCNTVS